MANMENDVMTKEVSVEVYGMIGRSIAVSAEDGQMVYGKIYPLLKKGISVSISFDKVEIIIPTFLNAAIGQLYGDDELTKDGKIEELLSYKNIESEDLKIINLVVENAKEYFKNPDVHRRAWQEELEDDEE